MPLILPGNVASATAAAGYEVANSVRFNDGDSAYVHRTPDASSNRRTMTYSFWVKRSTLSATQKVFSQYNSGNNYNSAIEFNSDDTLSVWDYTTSYQAHLKPKRLFRDVSAWYHIVVAIDTTQGTAANRMKLYINGTRETSFATETYPAEDLELRMNEYQIQNWGAMHYASTQTQFFDGYLAEVFFIDGSQLAVTTFGEFDEDSPTIWKPKDCKDDLTFGTNGYYLDFEDSGDLDDDESGNSNDFTTVNLAATDQCQDSPTNNFCTMNPLTQSEPGNLQTFAEGNCKITMANFDTESVMATMGVTAGKWYWEIKGGWRTGNWGFGIEKGSSSNIGFSVGYTATSYSFSQSGYKQYNSSATQIDSGLSDGDIIGYALDLDNGHFNFSQNGVWYNGSASESTTFDASNHDYTSLDFGSEFVMPTISAFGDTSITTEINFGNPSYANSSSNADGNGYGDFEYPPPSGYLALCTKNLGSTGG